MSSHHNCINPFKSYISLFCAQGINEILYSSFVVVNQAIQFMICLYLFNKAKIKIENMRNQNGGENEKNTNPTYCLLSVFLIRTVQIMLINIQITEFFEIFKICFGKHYFEYHIGTLIVSDDKCILS